MKKIRKPARDILKYKDSQKRPSNKIWLYGIHAVQDALKNKKRIKYELSVTPNAFKKLMIEVTGSKLRPNIIDPRKFSPPLEKNAVHQGVALSVQTLNWGSISEVCAPKVENKLVLLLDRVTDPQNVGAILRSADVFGTTAVITPARYSAPESGALAKAASGALERQPYLRIPNLAQVISSLKQMGYVCIGLDGTSNKNLVCSLKELEPRPVALIVGAEGPGLRSLTLKNCDLVCKITSYNGLGSLNVSNAAALALYIARSEMNNWR